MEVGLLEGWVVDVQRAGEVEDAVFAEVDSDPGLCVRCSVVPVDAADGYDCGVEMSFAEAAVWAEGMAVAWYSY